MEKRSHGDCAFWFDVVEYRYPIFDRGDLYEKKQMDQREFGARAGVCGGRVRRLYTGTDGAADKYDKEKYPG